MAEPEYYQTGYYLSVYIADGGCPIVDQNHRQIGQSRFGHMWISIDDPSGLQQSYGFHPADGDRLYSTTGEVQTHDLTSYVNPYKKRFPISQEMFSKLQWYCQKTLGAHTFQNYIVVVHECVDYAWDIMEAADVICFPATLYAGKHFMPVDNIPSVNRAYNDYIFHLNCCSSWENFKKRFVQGFKQIMSDFK